MARSARLDLEMSGDDAAAGRAPCSGDSSPGGYASGEARRQASARSLLSVSVLLLACYGVGIRLDFEPRQAMALGPVLLLRPWFLELIAWAAFFLAWYRHWACSHRRCGHGGEWQARQFARSPAAWELITRHCVEQNVFPDSRQLMLAPLAGNQRQLEALARSYLRLPGRASGKGALRVCQDHVELSFDDLQVQYRNVDASRTHVQPLGPIAVKVAREPFVAAMAEAGEASVPQAAVGARRSLPTMVAFAMLAVLLVRVLVLCALPR